MIFGFAVFWELDCHIPYVVVLTCVPGAVFVALLEENVKEFAVVKVDWVGGREVFAEFGVVFLDDGIVTVGVLS